MNAKNGISSYEIHRSLGVTQKTAWFMAHRIREVIRTGSVVVLSGTVGADESFMGGSDANRHASKKSHKRGRGAKTPVMGMVERGGQVVAKVIDAQTKKHLRSVLGTHVEKESVLYTDQFSGYHNLGGDYYRATINHKEGEYVRGDVHTNTIEGYWNLFKRCNIGTPS